jgi:hypothetical protein
MDHGCAGGEGATPQNMMAPPRLSLARVWMYLECGHQFHLRTRVIITGVHRVIIAGVHRVIIAGVHRAGSLGTILVPSWHWHDVL